jgi:SOS-response transcriptional repressor LexA
MSETKSVSERLKYLIDTLGVKQTHLASKLGLSTSGLHYILNNDIKFSKHAKKIAEYLDNNEPLLISEKKVPDTENHLKEAYKIPVYYPDQLKIYFHSQKKASINSADFFFSTRTYPNKVIGIYMIEATFSPKFEVGDMIAFEQTETFADGEILLVYLAKTSSITLKYGFKLKNEVALVSLEGSSTTFSKENGDIIIGAYRECLKRSSTL